MTSGLPGLPGSTADAGTGAAPPGSFEWLLDAADSSVERYREHRAAAYGDLVGPLIIHAAQFESFQQSLRPADHGLRVLLTADHGDPDALTTMRTARSSFLDDDRVELVGVQLPLPAGGDPAQQMRRLLDSLDFSAPAWIMVAPVVGWTGALDTLAADGAEHLCLTPSVGSQAFAAMLRAAIDRDLVFRIDARSDSSAVLQGLCAVRAALNGVDTDELAQILSAVDRGPLVSGIRRMSVADVAVVRAFLSSISVHDVAGVAEELTSLGLLEP